MSRGNLDKIYHKDSVNTDLLAKFCLVLNHDFFAHVNPFRRAEGDGSRRLPRLSVVAEDDVYEVAAGRLQAGMAQLERATQELDFLRQALQDAKSSHKDKDEIISLMKDKIAYQKGEIARLEEELAECSAGR